MFPARLLERLEPGLNLLSTEPLQEFDSPRSRSLLAGTDILITGWGCPQLDETVLDAAPNLRYILHAAGSAKHHVGQACWDRGLQVSTAADANAVPVAEYTVAMILLANKNVLQLARIVHTVAFGRGTRGLLPAAWELPQAGRHHRGLEDRPARDQAAALLRS